MSGGDYLPGGFGTVSSFNSNILDSFWDEYCDDLFLKEPSLTGLLVMLGNVQSHAETDDYKFNWTSFKERPRYVTITVNAAAGAGSAAVFTVSTADYLKLSKSNVLYDLTSGENFYISDTNTSESGSDLTTNQFLAYKVNPDSTTTSAIVVSAHVGHKLYVDATSIKDGWGDIANVAHYISSKQDENFYNYVMDFTEYTKVSESAANVKRRIMGNKRKVEIARAMKRVRERMEISFFRGAGGSLNTIGSDSIPFTKGIKNFAINSESGYYNTFSWNDWKEFYGKKVRLWNDNGLTYIFCNQAFRALVDKWAQEESELHFSSEGGADMTFGYSIGTLRSSLGKSRLIETPILTHAYDITENRAIAYVLDVDSLKIRFWAGKEDRFSLQTMLDPDGREDREHRRYYTDEVSAKCGIQVGEPARHSLLELLP